MSDKINKTKSIYESIKEDQKTTITLHIRRTDYLQYEDIHHIIKDNQWYQKAIDTFLEAREYFKKAQEVIQVARCDQKLAHCYIEIADADKALLYAQKSVDVFETAHDQRRLHQEATHTESIGLVLIDGRSVYTPTFSGVFWDTQDYLFEDIERIEVETFRFASVMNNPEPPNSFGARYSLPHAAAALLVRGHAGHASWPHATLPPPQAVARLAKGAARHSDSNSCLHSAPQQSSDTLQSSAA